MTFEERVRAVAAFGFNDIQTRFLVTAALHSGFCLPRHYTTFSGLQYGSGVRSFFDRLVTHRLAERYRFRQDRGDVFHLSNSVLYDVIGQNDNRNRRHASPAVMARKLMLLDYVLGSGEGAWLATEQEKVAFFASKGIPQSHLPQRVYVGRDRSRTQRYFIEKFPIQLVGSPMTIHFICLVTDLTGDAFESFLAGHQALLRHLPRWRVVAVVPPHIAGLPACERAFTRIGTSVQFPENDSDELRKFFTTRNYVERRERDKVDESFLTRFLLMEERLEGHPMLIAYQRFLEDGVVPDERAEGAEVRRAVASGDGGLITHQLPHSYDRFGSFAGIA